MTDAGEPFLQGIFRQAIPHVAALGISLEEVAERRLVLRLPYRDCLVGDPETGLLHGGAVTTLIDTACGLVAMAALTPPRPVATLDLRIDHLRPAVAGSDLLVEADCARVTREVVFTRAAAYQGDGRHQIAAALGTFMITRRNEP